MAIHHFGLEDLFQISINFFAAYYPCDRLSTIRLADDAGREVVLPVPRRPAQQPGAPVSSREYEPNEDGQAVLEMLRESDRRMTLPDILDEFRQRGQTVSESTLMKELARMVNKGLLINPNDKKGYGLP